MPSVVHISLPKQGKRLWGGGGGMGGESELNHRNATAEGNGKC